MKIDYITRVRHVRNMISAGRHACRASAGKDSYGSGSGSGHICLKSWKVQRTMKPILIKPDRELGYAYFCPHCKSFQCLGEGPCTVCGKLIDWTHSVPYEGRVRWTT